MPAHTCNNIPGMLQECDPDSSGKDTLPSRLCAPKVCLKTPPWLCLTCSCPGSIIQEASGVSTSWACWLLHGDKHPVHSCTWFHRTKVCNCEVLSQLPTVLLHPSHLRGDDGEMCQMGRGSWMRWAAANPVQAQTLLHVPQYTAVPWEV